MGFKLRMVPEKDTGGERWRFPLPDYSGVLTDYERELTTILTSQLAGINNINPQSVTLSSHPGLYREALRGQGPPFMTNSETGDREAHRVYHTLGRHSGGLYTPFNTLREAPWWVCTPTNTLREAPWWVMYTLLHP